VRRVPLSLSPLQSRIHSYRGARYVELALDGDFIYKVGPDTQTPTQTARHPQTPRHPATHTQTRPDTI
jgi:hypothetical protein